MKKFLNLICLIVVFHVTMFSRAVYGIPETIRVAFLPEMTGFYEITENGSYSGYNYDYLMKIAQHTHWNFEFVIIEEGTISASLRKAEEMLYEGEIDLLGPYSGTSSRIDDFQVGERNYGVYRYNFYSARNNYAITRDNYFMLDTIRVALVESYTDLNEKFLYLAKDASYDLDITYVKTHAETLELLLAEKVDAIINLDLSINANYLDYLSTIDRIPFYFVSTEGNTELVAQVDEAIRKIEVIEPSIHQKLSEIYFGVRYEGDLILTDKEFESLEGRTSFKVGFLTEQPPYQYINSSGENTGISIDILKKFEEIIGLPFEVYWYDELYAIYEALESQEIDMMGTLSNDAETALSLGVTLTDPYLSSGVYWLKSGLEEENPTPMYHYVSDPIPFYRQDELVMILNIKSELDKLEKSGSISVFCDPNITEYYLSKYNYENIVVQAVSNVLSEISFGVGEHIDENIIGMLNRTILFLDSFEVDEFVFNHTSVKPEYTFWDVLNDYAFEINIVAFILGTIVFMYVYNNSKKFRELSRRDSLTKLYSSGYFHEYAEERIKNISFGALILVDIDYFKNVNDTHGHHAGDEVIKLVAKNMEKFAPLGSFNARLGGDEFAVLIECPVDQRQLEENATSILEALAQNELGIPTTLSIGGFIFETATEYKYLYKNADAVLYDVKENGRNGFRIKKA